MSHDALMACRALDVSALRRRALSTKAVCIALADFHNERTGNCNPGHRTLARHAGVQSGSIWKIVKRIEQDGFIAIDSGRPGRGDSYRLRFLDTWRKLGQPSVFKLTGTTGQFDHPEVTGTTGRQVTGTGRLGDRPEPRDRPAPDAKPTGPDGQNLAIPFNQGESASKHASGPAPPEKNRQPEFEKLIDLCMRLDLRGSNHSGIQNAIEENFGFTPTRNQVDIVERQIIDRRKE